MRAPSPPPALLTLLISVLPISEITGESSAFTTHGNHPMGSREQPLLLRTYFPDPGLSREVMAHHDLGRRARKYSPAKGDVPGLVEPIRGIPAAIGVNFGPDLSICWDTTECRLLYAWQGGFLEMTNYWGKPESGRRKGFGYVPELNGTLIYLAQGDPPLALFHQFTDNLAPEYLGYRLVEGVPEFRYRRGESEVRVRIEPGSAPFSIVKHYTIESPGAFDYAEDGYRFEITDREATHFTVTVTGKAVTPGAGPAADEPSFSTEKPNLEWGESLYTTLGCLACHSTDGTRGHGPTFSGLFGAERTFAGGLEPTKADESYLKESISNPLAKVVEGFPPGYMPPYTLDEKQVDSLLLFIRSLQDE